MEFGILGPLEVRDRGRQVRLRGQKQKAILAILLLNANRVVSSDRLIDELWGEEPPESGSVALQVRISELRRALSIDGGRRLIVTRSPGYLIQVEPDELDLLRFERLLARGSRALAAGNAEAASGALAHALALWRGQPLADFTYETFAQPAIARLEDLRLAALEQRVEADLALGRHSELVVELDALVAEHPLSERLRGQQMLALYRAGRQAAALGAYRDARRKLVDEFGIEPGPALQELERAILRQDPGLGSGAVDLREAATQPPERSILVITSGGENTGALVEVSEALALLPPREVILAWLVGTRAELTDASALLRDHREALAARGVVARATTFTSHAPGEDAVRLAREQAVDVLLVEAPRELIETGVPPGHLRTILERSPCDVGILVPRRDGSARVGPDHPILVPFGGAEHDWAAVELAAWIAKAAGAGLQLLGSEADPGTGARDASRLLSRVSLVVQRATGLIAEPLLVPPGPGAIAQAAETGGLLVLGVSSRERRHGLGTVRQELIRTARPPALLVRKGVRPGGLAPPETLTRFTWSLTQIEARPIEARVRSRVK